MEHPAYVLLADDEVLAALALEYMLMAKGFRVSIAGDGLQALGIAERGCPDVLVTDLRMPRLDGRGLIRSVRRRCPSLPVVVTTGFPPGGAAALQEKAGPLVLLTKPIDPEQFLASITDVLSTK